MAHSKTEVVLFVTALVSLTPVAGLLKTIPHIISPQLLKAIAEMGHGDRILLGDSNNPV